MWCSDESIVVVMKVVVEHSLKQVIERWLLYLGNNSKTMKKSNNTIFFSWKKGMVTEIIIFVCFCVHEQGTKPTFGETIV